MNMEQTLIYKLGGPHRGPNGTTYDFKSAKIGDRLDFGWYFSLTEAVLAKQKKSK